MAVAEMSCYASVAEHMSAIELSELDGSQNLRDHHRATQSVYSLLARRSCVRILDSASHSTICECILRRYCSGLQMSQSQNH